MLNIAHMYHVAKNAYILRHIQKVAFPTVYTHVTVPDEFDVQSLDLIVYGSRIRTVRGYNQFTRFCGVCNLEEAEP